MAANKKPSTEVANWDEELAKLAESSAKMEAHTGGGSFFSIKSGVLSWQDNPLKNNEMAVIILDSILENVFYEGEWDPDNIQSPTCFAFGRDEDEMAPHKMVVEAGNEQYDRCNGCEKNEFGSAEKGKGKACRNTRRLAMIPAGHFAKDGSFEIIEDLDHFETAEVGFMKLPVTSVKGFSTFVKQVASTIKRPPFGIITKVEVVPDAKSQFKVLFEPLMNVPDDVMQAIFKRHKDTAATIDFPYTPFEEEAEEERPKAKGKAKPPAKSAAKTPAKRGRY